MDNYDNLLERLTAILSESAARRSKVRGTGHRNTKLVRVPVVPKKVAKNNGLAAA